MLFLPKITLLNRMLKLQTPVDIRRSGTPVSLRNRIMVLGSCFADYIGKKFSVYGFDACVNPFGTLYNPASIISAVQRLHSGEPFMEDDCVEMGAGAGLICSFHHHTSFARATAEEFIADANASLASAHAKWAGCDRVVVTLGTAWCFRHLPEDEIVANCLKRPAGEFQRVRLSLDEVTEMLLSMVDSHPDKRFIFTVSPVRHMADGANGNQLSKSTLLLAVDRLVSAGKAEYFPSYEIMMDELRDYRFYAEDMVHPSQQAVDHIWDRFCDYAVPSDERQELIDNEKAYRRSQHRKLHKDA